MSEAASAKTSGEVLVVEDEPMIRMDLVETLCDLGFQVCDAGTTAEAKELLDRKDGTIVALVTDMNLPDGTGRELAQLARRLHRDLPVIFTSGYGPDGMKGGQDEHTTFVTKPFHPQQVADVLVKMGINTTH